MMMEMCGDNRFEVIARAKEHLLDATNIETSEEEMAVFDNFLFRCWQMGWLDKYDEKIETEPKWIPCSERLPSESDYYLATIINGFNEEEVCVIWFAHADDYNMVASEWREITDEDTVIAWQPLPTPYTERSNNE